MLKERGLLEVFADVPYAEQSLNELPGRGPDNRAGCILAYQTPQGQVPRRLGYYSSEQTWTPIGDGSLLWIGVDSAEPPKPEEMARKKQYGGYRLDFSDGQPWLVPIIRRPDGTTELPTDMVWDATGKLIEPIKARYQAFWDVTAEALPWFFDGQEVDRERALQVAIDGLSINYRLGRNEQNILRIVDGENLMLILAAMIDAPSGPKKTDLAMNAERGCVESSPLTDRAAAICS